MRSKYNVDRSDQGKARRTVDNIVFHSVKEADRYKDLKLLLRDGTITGLVMQPRFPLVVNGMKVCTYVADFEYWQGGRCVTEDVKGCVTALYRLKSKLFSACYPGKTIAET